MGVSMCRQNFENTPHSLANSVEFTLSWISSMQDLSSCRPQRYFCDSSCTGRQRFISLHSWLMFGIFVIDPQIVVLWSSDISHQITRRFNFVMTRVRNVQTNQSSVQLYLTKFFSHFPIICTVLYSRMSHRKHRESKQQLSLKLDLALLGCSLISLFPEQHPAIENGTRDSEKHISLFEMAFELCRRSEEVRRRDSRNLVEINIAPLIGMGILTI